MMSMGYFRTPRRLYGKKCSERELSGGESLHATLLSMDAAGDDEVPKGYFAVYVGAEARRFVVPTSYLRRPAFRELMERAAEEFGFSQEGGIRIPCREEDFRATVAALEVRRRWRRPSTTCAGKMNAMANWPRLGRSLRLPMQQI